MEWAQGALLSPADQRQAEVMGDLAELSCNDIRRFYGMDEVEND